MAAPCYSGKNPIDTQEDRTAVWKWAKEFGGIDAGKSIKEVHDAINQHFYFGQGKPEWITDILSGRKTPLRQVATDMWRKQYNRRMIVQEASDLSKRASMGTFGKVLDKLWTFPRTIAVAGHGVVFPITHGGDLAFRPATWGTFFRGTLQTYIGAFNRAYAGRVLSTMEADKLYDLGLRSGVDMGRGSHPSGLISRTYHGPAQRAWDMLTAMRFNLWKGQVERYLKPGMSEADALDIGKQMADWANHATGSAKGPIASLGGALFGPKLTQSKLSRMISDPVQTVKTFANWGNATPGEKAVAWTRLSGAAQFLTTNLGFLAVNQGLMYALGSNEKVNVTDPTKSDYFSFKGGGIVGNVPGMHSEIRTLAHILAVSFMSRKETRGESRFTTAAKIAGLYATGKLTPAIQRGAEIGFGQNWLGRPLPWSSDPGTANKPRMSWGEYAASIGPIPLEGPIGFVYDQLKEGGASALDATAIIKGLIISGLGLPGFHVREALTVPQVVSSRRPMTDREMSARELRRARGY